MTFTRNWDGKRVRAFQYQGIFSSPPDWLKDTGAYKEATEDSPPEVKILTGKYWTVKKGDWIVIDDSYVYLVEDVDMKRSYKE